MSPAAVEFISPPQMQSKQLLTPENTNPHFPSTFGASSINNPSEKHRSLFQNAADSGFACGLDSPSSDSTLSRRSKPRLVKRRQLGFQRGKCPTSAPPRKGSGLNSNQANNACSGNTSNGFSSSIEDFMHGKLNTAGFVFGVSSLLSNFNAEMKQTSRDGIDRFNDGGFVFVADRSNCGSNSNLEDKESSNDGGKLTACEFGKPENVGSLFGDHRSSSNRSSLMSNLNMENTQSSGMGQTNNGGFVFGLYESNSDSDHNESSAGMVQQYDANEFDESKNVGLLFGNNASSPLLHLNLENGQCGESKGKSGDKVEFLFGANNSCSITNPDPEMRQFGAYEFASNGQHGNVMRNSKSEDRESDENVVKLASDERGRMDLDFREVDDLGFVYHGNGSGLRINLNSVKIESAENGGKPVPIDSQKAKAGGKFDKVDFVFGDCPEASSATSDLEKSEPSQSSGNMSFEDSGKMKLHIEGETQKEEAHDVFIFGSSSKKNPSFSANIDQMNKVSPENDTGFVDTYFDKLDFLINNRSKILSGSNVNATVSSETSTISKLSEEMRKMNVGDCKNMGCSYGTKDPNMDSSASSKPAFVFGNNKSFPGFCTSKSSTTFCDQLKNGGNDGAVERTTRFNFRIIEEDALVFASSSNAACSSDEGAQHVIGKNQRISSGLGVSDEQIKLGCHFRGCLWEEKQPRNANDNSSNASPVCFPTPNPSIFQTGLGERPRDQLNDHPKLNITSNKALFPSIGLDSEELSMGRVNNADNLRFASTPLGERGALKDFRTANGHTSCAFMVNLSSGLNKKFESSGKSRSHRDKRWKTRRGKWRRAFPESRHNHVSKQDSQQNTKSPRSYSPMDFSPYQDNNCPPSTSNVTSFPRGKNKVLEAVSEGANISKADKKCESNEEDLYSPNQRIVDSSLEETQTDCSNSNMKREESECKKQDQFGFASREKNVGEGNFTFSASCTQDKSPSTNRQSQKKYRMKVVHAPSCTTPSQKVDATYFSVQFPVQPRDKERNLNFPDSRYKGNKERDKQGSNAPTEKACQKWRIRGNQAYEKGYMSKAEELYTKGINSVSHSEASGCCIEPLVLCYSNRAAARMSLGRIREALGDCMQAAALDPNFHKVQIRAANCHLAMGEVEVALQYFSKCLEPGAELCLDRRITIEAANGLQKAQKVAKCVNQCAELVQQRTCYAAISALELISGVFSLSSYSEKLLEIKGEALLMLRRYEEVIQLCEQTLVFAEKNVATVAGDNNLGIVDAPTYNNSSIRLWRWHLMAKSYFHLGRLEVALDLLEKQELLRSSEDSRGSNIQESSIPFAVTVRELSLHKNAGNEAFQSGRHTEAVEHYTSAISISIESRPFASICFCNRAAAHQALGQISDAIADCSLAIALDESYSKAISRRATLHEKIRDYEQAACDLQILISLLEKQSQEELTQARRSHYSMEEKAKKGMPLDHYLILGIKQSDTASEIKKAYRKAALKHHPDKVDQFLARSESGDDGKQWKEIADEVHKDADRLFKMIGEAYAVLSDPIKRSQYDLQEELRMKQEKNGSRGSRGSTEFYSSPSRTTANGRYRQGPCKTSGYSYYHQW